MKERWKNKQSKQLFKAFLELKNVEEVANFCRDLMTETEIEEFATRFEIAKQLYEGKTQRDIAKDVEASITTVTRVNQWLKRGMDGYKKVLTRQHQS
jgi:TrpR-related protein YerC/YecD